MRLTPFSKPYGYAHLKRMEKEGDVAGLTEALGASRVERSPNLRAAAITSLRKVGGSKAVPAVCKLLSQDSSEAVRCGSARALGELGDDAAIPPLRAALEDESNKVQMWAICSLGKLGDGDSVERLVGKLDDPDWGIRGFAATALGELGDQRAIAALIPLLQDSSSTVRLAAGRALEMLGHIVG